MPIDDPGWGAPTPEPPKQTPPPGYKEKLAGLKTSRGKLGKLDEKQMIMVGVAVVALILVAGLVRSKGDDEKPPSARGAAPAAAAGEGEASDSQEEFVEKVDAVCSSYAAQVQQAVGAPDSTALGAVHGSMLAEIKALGTPPEDADVFQRLVTNYESSIQMLNQGNPAAANPFGHEASAAAIELGAPSCS